MKCLGTNEYKLHWVIYLEALEQEIVVNGEPGQLSRKHIDRRLE